MRRFIVIIVIVTMIMKIIIIRVITMLIITMIIMKLIMTTIMRRRGKRRSEGWTAGEERQYTKNEEQFKGEKSGSPGWEES